MRSPGAAPPDGDEQVHGDQHPLPEYVEEDRVEADEDPYHGRLHEEEDDNELLEPVLDLFP
jgi:hypothetical protein